MIIQSQNDLVGSDLEDHLVPTQYLVTGLKVSGASTQHQYLTELLICFKGI